MLLSSKISSVLFSATLLISSRCCLSSSAPRSSVESPQQHVDKWALNAKKQVGAAMTKVYSCLDEVAPNFSGIIRSRTSLPGYERGAGIPVYMVTTSWGSPYVINEKLNDIVRSKASLDKDVILANMPPDQDTADDEMMAKPEDDETIYDEDDEGDEQKQKKQPESEEEREAFMQMRLVKKYKGLKVPSLRTQRTVSMAPMFVDPKDAQSMLMEMKATGYDVRITATSMARALRQASVLGNGLPTSQTISADTGTVDGGYMRYKLVPSSRELYYASHCDGCERVGFTTPEEEEEERRLLSIKGKNKINMSIRNKFEQGISSTGKLIPRWTVPFELVGRRSSPSDSKKQQEGDATKQLSPKFYLKNGKKSIPVFYAAGLEMESPRKKLLSLVTKKSNNDKSNNENPMFFSYEDLLSAWTDMRTRQQRKAATIQAEDTSSKETGLLEEIPRSPPKVEVFSYVDVVTSIDKEQHQKQVTKFWKWKRNIVWNKKAENKTSISATATPGEIENIVFIPSSKSVRFKEELSRTGNCKARLRPMR